MSEFGGGQHEVTIKVPARAEYVSVIRTLAATLAARCDLTVDEIDDLRIGVDEACGLLLSLAPAGSEAASTEKTDPPALTSTFTLREGSIAMYACVDVEVGVHPDDSGFAWTVLHAVADEVHVEVQDSLVAIHLLKQRQSLDA